MTPRRKQLRAEVHDRDKAVCSDCGLDCDRLRDRYVSAELTDEQHIFYACPKCEAGWPDSGPCAACGWKQTVRRTSRDARHAIEQELSYRAWPIGQIMAMRRSGASGFAFWQADHTAPLAEEGPDEIGNLRTLCIGCHAAWTAGLRGRLAKVRKAKERKRHRKDCRKLSWLNEGPCTCGEEARGGEA
jgi:hypothetical protein